MIDSTRDKFTIEKLEKIYIFLNIKNTKLKKSVYYTLLMWKAQQLLKIVPFLYI